MSKIRESLTKPKIELNTPKFYKVILHNDEITTMDFVVDILVRIFKKDYEQACNVMMDIHEKGSGVAGVYTYDISATKKIEVDRLALINGFPLKTSLEEDVE